jgi:hypothetical protein
MSSRSNFIGRSRRSTPAAGAAASVDGAGAAGEGGDVSSGGGNGGSVLACAAAVRWLATATTIDEERQRVAPVVQVAHALTQAWS